ncbi:MAG TPA: hypothetical protein H9867_09140 [Candidatus Corynebacterium gallistercoris]|uniref:Uncharacterized protein n=1 Tax=Candidatus Corynebacterium gallistercoris TaxID=2838530 RepID=A0A9D1S1N6_9CORY|nr:hypothetical protein [Candidatus Corynebacterium gallistercoris]
MSITRTLVSLHWTLWRRNNIGNFSLLILALFSYVFGLVGASTLGVWSAAELTNDDNPHTFVATMGLGSLLYLMMAVMFPAGESTMDWRQFGTLPVTARQLLPATIITIFLQTRGFLALINTVIMAVIGATAFGSLGAGLAVGWVVACIAQLVVTVAMGEALAALLNNSTGRQHQEKVSLIGSALFMVGFLFFYMSINSNVEALFTQELPLLSWSPFATAAAALAYQPFGADSLARAAITLAVVVLCAWVWLNRTMTMLRHPVPDSGSGGSRRRSAAASTPSASGSLLLPGAPATAWGAAFSRAVRYYRRDLRYLYMTMSFPLLAVFYLFLGARGEDSFFHYFGLYFMAMMATTLMSNIFGMDGPHNWVHITTGVHPRTMLTARMAATAVVIVPLIAAYGLAGGLLSGFEPLWIANVFIATGFTVIMLSLSTYQAVKIPQRTSPPGTNSFSMKNSGNAQVALWVFATSLSAATVSLPAFLLVIFDHPFAAVAVELVIAAACCWFLVRAASAHLGRTWPATFEKVQRFM